MMVSCAHGSRVKYGKDRLGNQRWKCQLCGKTWIEAKSKPLGKMTVPVETAKTVLRLLAEGNSLRGTSRLTGLHAATVAKILVHFGQACQRFLDERLRGLTPEHLELDEQWTYILKKQDKLTVDERRTRHDAGDCYIWTATDQRTKLLVSFRLGKRTGDNARRFLMDVASRLAWPKPHQSDAHAFMPEAITPVIQLSSDAFAAYPEAVDLAFGGRAKYGQIVKEFRNAKIIYTPSEIVGVKRRAVFQMTNSEVRSICTSHVERLNGTQRLMLKRLNRLTYCFSKRLRNLEAAFSLFAAWYNFTWRTRKPGKSGKLRPTAAMMAGLTDHIWTFDELFEAVLRPSTQV
jgi:transposase-like protein/IS1 family transposase